MMKWLIQLVVAVGLAGGAAWYGYRFATPPRVTSIRVTKLASMPELKLPSKPDYYLVLQLAGGETRQLQTFRNTPIGNGLIWPLDEPIPLDELSEIQLYDQNRVFSDEMLDRAIVDGPVLRTPQHGFELTGPQPRERMVAWAAGVPAAGWALVCLIMLVRHQAIAPKDAA